MSDQPAPRLVALNSVAEVHVVHVHYRGMDRNGAGVNGGLHTVERALAPWIERRFRRGWRWLEVFSDGPDSRQVGGIDAGGLVGRRTWWSE